LNQLIETDIIFDIDKIKDLYNKYSHIGDRFSVTSRGTPDLSDGTLAIQEYPNATEWSWNTLYPEFIGTIIEDIYWTLREEWVLGRGRFMNMSKSNRALSFHYDECYRLHIPVYTNENSWFMLEDKTLHQMPEEGRLYILDANRHHSAMNLDREQDRVHLVFSAKRRINSQI